MPDSGQESWASEFDGGFIIRNFDWDFVVFVALNRGFRYRRKQSAENDGRKEPHLYIFPATVVQVAQDPTNKWGKTFLRNIEDVDQYVNNWVLVKAFLDFEES